VVAGGIGDAASEVALLAERGGRDPMAYLCRAYSCEAPTNDPVTFAEQLDALRAPASA
jgi:hypothetical protein